MFGGRWNSPGLRAVYTAESLSLARAELARHINLESIPDGFSVYEIEIPDEHLELLSPLPETWKDDPPTVQSQEAGDQMLADRETLGFQVPSTIDEASFNIVLNPRSRSFQDVRVARQYPFVP
jgi:RES domain-containing protein